MGERFLKVHVDLLVTFICRRERGRTPLCCPVMGDRSATVPVGPGENGRPPVLDYTDGVTFFVVTVAGLTVSPFIETERETS